MTIIRAAEINDELEIELHIDTLVKNWSFNKTKLVNKIVDLNMAAKTDFSELVPPIRIEGDLVYINVGFLIGSTGSCFNIMFDLE